LDHMLDSSQKERYDLKYLY